MLVLKLIILYVLFTIITLFMTRHVAEAIAQYRSKKQDLPVWFQFYVIFAYIAIKLCMPLYLAAKQTTKLLLQR